MGSNAPKNRESHGLLLAAMILMIASVAAWWPARFIKKLTTPPLAAGSAAPQFELESLSGEVVSLGQFEGKAVLLKFWSVG